MRTESRLHRVDEEQALRRILEGTAAATGERFFAALVENLALALQVHGAWVTELDAGANQLRSVAFWLGGQWIPEYAYPIAGTPCEPVIRDRRMLHIPDRILELFPGDNDLSRLGAVSYLGFPLLDTRGEVMGNLAVIDTRPLPEEPRCLDVFRIFAARAAAEHQRMRAEAALREREAQLAGLVASAHDAIIELDEELRVTRMNPAAEQSLRYSSEQLCSVHLADLLGNASAWNLDQAVAQLTACPDPTAGLWIVGGLRLRRRDGGTLEAETSLSRYLVERRPRYTVILRDLEKRRQAEQQIRSLTVETQLLREELKAQGGSGDFVGDSPPMRRLLEEINEVAGTDATVLITGETGTGKELIAGAIHARSRRQDKPLVKVNCAAVPAALMESEFFGHEKGAFTGATQRREGRFALAHGGTLFLDEVGELPLDLQAKLLRVLQEGEFEPLGGARTVRVDVRVVAATNRDLRQAVRQGSFREDLYYRLHVFPIEAPPLRERGDDVVLLASAFAERLAATMGRRLAPLGEPEARRLKAYAWPGNVRELRNVIERAVITARNGTLNLDRALPEGPHECAQVSESATVASPDRILTTDNLRELERANIVAALDACSWRVAGAAGAAARLGMRPSTLTSRMKALGIRRPD